MSRIQSRFLQICIDRINLYGYYLIMSYYPRIIENTLREYLKIFPAVAVTGPRQSGKSTLLKEVFLSEYAYVTFDDPVNIDLFRTDPKGFMKTYAGKTIFDEVQKVPEIFNYLKIMIDSDRTQYGKFILTGSNQFQVHKQITETLAGRIGLLSLLPFQLTETPPGLRSEFILNGSYPELIARQYLGAREWYASYIQNYIERDVRNITQIENLRDFQRLLFLLAARTSQELNMSSLSADIGVTVKTVQKWISVLEASYLVFLLPPFHRNYGKRIVKRPKIYFYDTGLVCYLTGLRSLETLNQGPLAGPVFENLVVSDIKKNVLNRNRDAALYYFRTNAGLEVDLIIETNDKIIPMEIKQSATFRMQMAGPLMKIMQLEAENKFNARHYDIQGKLLYQGEEKYDLSGNVSCLNYLQFLA